MKVFLEVLNSVLMTGEIPGLFAKDEMMAMPADLRNSSLKVKKNESSRPTIIATWYTGSEESILSIAAVLQHATPRKKLRLWARLRLLFLCGAGLVLQ